MHISMLSSRQTYCANLIQFSQSINSILSKTRAHCVCYYPHQKNKTILRLFISNTAWLPKMLIFLTVGTVCLFQVIRNDLQTCPQNFPLTFLSLQLVFLLHKSYVYVLSRHCRSDQNIVDAPRKKFDQLGRPPFSQLESSTKKASTWLLC